MSLNASSNHHYACISTTNKRTGEAILNTVAGKMTKMERESTYLEAISRLYDCGYYWGPISHEFSEKLLKSRENGSFLVRDSKHDNYLFTITFKSNEYVYHVRIKHISNGLFNFQNNISTIESKDIKSFIDTVIEKSRSGHSFFIRAANMNIKFLHPVSRFKDRSVCSLQHLARFEILKHCRKDNVDKLVLPSRFKLYLKQSQIFIEYNPLSGR